MAASRVVSLAPSATATVAALGAADRLVGVTAHCELSDDPDAGSAHGEGSPTVVGGWLNPDLDRVVDLDPDVVLTSDALQADLADDCRDRLDRIADAVADRPRPTAYCEEWSDPPMAAGNWVPDAVRAAGGRYPFVDPGERSREVDPAAVARADPDHVVVHVCGHGDRVDPATVAERDWVDAPVHVVDDSLLNQPSPALIDGVERLAHLLHPEAFSAAGDDPEA
ncbi:cobalamin-binding protein [Halorubrum sp. SP3]|uniref:helical backbone metal receptor n=1 Tax=Halorubrum sp. SP3 TaxID=1537265 RepID=UPI0010F65A13|nr:helical backbone metal receptor [Halorubrum sp. SP3]TKX53086.1 cobalamin-binding protein [Halorubrum sp. SP3]